jgi:hypothetical protein
LRIWFVLYFSILSFCGLEIGFLKIFRKNPGVRVDR